MEDLKFGVGYERKFINIKGFENYEKKEGYFKEYDIICYDECEEGIKYEVKTDRMAFETGNLCIEYECNSKPSGIETTKADYYVYFVITDEGYNMYEIPTKKIKKMIERVDYHNTMRGGDMKKSKFCLFKLNLFDKYLTRERKYKK